MCVYMCVCCIFLCKTVSVLYEQAVCLRVNAKGQQFIRVQIVEGAQVRQAQEEFREKGGVIRTTASDQ